MLVRFEVDCVEKTNMPKQTSSTKITTSTRTASNKLDDLVNQMSTVSIDLGSVKKFDNDSSSSLHYIEHGKFDENEKLVELTTKSVYKGTFTFPEHKWNQLFFSQTDALVIGWHSRGNLQRIEKLTFNEVLNYFVHSKKSLFFIGCPINPF